MKTKTEVILETTQYYIEDPNRRAVTDKGSCMYTTPNGKHCAFAFNVTKEALPRLQEGKSAKDAIIKLGINILKEDRKIDNIHFWNELQHWHDYEDCWGPEGITRKGQQEIQRLLEEYKD